jgi:hypothetical protein
VDEITRIQIEHHHQKALEILQSLPFEAEMTAEMIGLMQEMLGRER